MGTLECVRWRVERVQTNQIPTKARTARHGQAARRWCEPMTTTQLRAVLVPDAGRLGAVGGLLPLRAPPARRGRDAYARHRGGAGARCGCRSSCGPSRGRRTATPSLRMGFPAARLDGLSDVPKDAVDWGPRSWSASSCATASTGPRCFADATARNEVFFIDPRLPLEFRETHRRHMRRNLRLGFVSTVPSGAARPRARSGRASRRSTGRPWSATARASRYFFSDAYFEELFSSPGGLARDDARAGRPGGLRGGRRPQ